jgi:futalosine hydrolase
MPVRILYVAATDIEADVFSNINGIVRMPDHLSLGNFEIRLLVSGIGAVSTAWSLKQWLSANDTPDLAINAGIAGSYSDHIKTGDVVMPVTDCFADAGIEDGDKFLTLYEAGLAGKNDFPFREGLLFSDPKYNTLLESVIKPVSAITVNTATGSEETRNKLYEKFNPDIETMEGATFFYLCLRENIPFFALRAISNKVEARNRSSWNIKLALDNLGSKLNEVLTKLK